MTHEPDPSDSEAQAFDDRRGDDADDDCPRGTYEPIVERPENTHIGYSDPDPAIDDASDVATWEEEVVA